MFKKLRTLLKIAMSKMAIWVDESQVAAKGEDSVPAGELVAPPCDCKPAAAAVAAAALPESLGTAASSSVILAVVALAVAPAVDAGSWVCDSWLGTLGSTSRSLPLPVEAPCPQENLLQSTVHWSRPQPP